MIFQNIYKFFLHTAHFSADQETQGKNVQLIIVQLVVTFFLGLNAILYPHTYPHLNEIEYRVPYIAFFLQLTLLFFFRFFKSPFQPTLISAVICSIPTLQNVFITGGIFSRSLIYIQLIMVALILMYNKRVAIWTGILCHGVVVAFYVLNRVSDQDFKHDRSQISDTTDLINLLFFFLISFFLFYFYAQKKNQLKQELDETKAKQVEELDRLLALKTTELEIRNEELKKVRQEMMADFHDELGNRLASLKMQAELALQKGKKNDQNYEMIMKIQENATDFYFGTRNFIWSMRETEMKLDDLFTYLRDFSFQLFETSEIEMIYEVEDREYPTVSSKKTRQILMICKEWFTNVLKHSNATEVRFKLFKDESLDEYQIEIFDNGVGFDLNQKSSGLGLKSMRSRAAKLEANFQIFSTVSMGSGMRLTVK